MTVHHPPQNLKSWQIPFQNVAIYESYSRTSGFMKEAIPQPETAASSLIRENRFDQLNQAARDAQKYQAGWDGYGAPVPSDMSVNLTVNVLGRIKNSDLNPFSVLPSADGGIGISFRGKDNRRAVLEIMNDGTASYMLYSKGDPTLSADFNASGDLTAMIQTLKEYL
jgi:hypothetical protein